MSRSLWSGYLSFFVGQERFGGVILPTIKVGDGYFAFENTIHRTQVLICQSTMGHWLPKKWILTA